MELASESLAQLLLIHGYLDPAAQPSCDDAPGPSSAGGATGSPTDRGEALLQAVMQLGHREDEGAAPGAQNGVPWAGLNLGLALAERFGLAGRVEAAVRSGYVSLDEAQSDYLAALLGVPSLNAAPVVVPQAATAGAGAGDGSGSGSGNGSAMDNDAQAARLSLIAQAGATLPLGGHHGRPAEHAQRGPQSRARAPTAAWHVLRAAGRDLRPCPVSPPRPPQVKDLLPDYGDGFVAACLDAYGGSAEAVVGALLEGSLPASVAKLDQSMPMEMYRRHHAQRAAAGAAAARPAAAAAKPGPAPARAAAEAAPSSRYLDLRERTYRGSLQAHATAQQVHPPAPLRPLARLSGRRALPDPQPAPLRPAVHACVW